MNPPAQPLKLVSIITDSGLGGSESVLGTLLKGWDRSKIEPVGVVVLKTLRENGQDWRQLGIPVDALGMGRVPTLAHLKKLKSIIRERRPDAVYASLFHSIQAARLVHLMGTQTKLITSPRINYRFASSWARQLDRCLKGADTGVITESESSRSYLIDQQGYAREKVRVVRNGVDGEKYGFSAQNRDRIRKEWSISPDTIVIGGVGRLHPQKGYDLLLEALSLLKNQRRRLKLVLVGEGQEENYLREMAKNYSIDVLFAGARMDAAAVYAAFDVFVQSSRYEGLSNSLLEALAAGRPVVATAVDGTLEVAQDGVNMLLVKPNDAISLSVGIGCLLEKPALRETVSKGAVQSAQNLSLRNMIRGYEEAFLKFIYD